MDRRSAGTRTNHRQPENAPRPRGLAWVLALAIALLVTSGPGAAATSEQGHAAGVTPPAVAVSDPIADLAWTLEYDPEKILRFVADEIAYEPYPGILRGALGTLQARAGNSVDKSLLLGALLDASLVRYRFARGPLDAATVATIVEGIPTDAATARRTAGDALVRGLDDLAASAPEAVPTDAPIADLEELQALERTAQERLQVAGARLDETVAMISRALDGAGVQLPAEGVTLPPAEVDGHTWVQIAAGSTWQDLDPTLAGAVSGTALAAASETVDRLPDDLRHRVEFRVLVERVSGGELVTQPDLEYATYADEIAGRPLTFAHMTASGMKALGMSLSNLLGQGWIDYRPMLDVGTGSVVGQAVAFPSGTATDLFGDAPSPAAGAGPVEGEATAEWLEVQVTAPGSPPAVARRAVFDRLPPDVRHGGTPSVAAVQPIALVDLEGTGSLDYPPMLGVETFAVATGPTSAVAVMNGPEDHLSAFPVAYHALRDALDAQLGLDAGARTFIDGPDIVSASVTVDGDAETPTYRVGLDIWHRSHGTLPLTGSPLTSAAARIIAGVTAHVTERFALDGVTQSEGSTGSSVGVGDVFEAAAAQGIPTVVLQGTLPASSGYGPQATELIEAAMTAGDVVVIPERPVMLGDTQRVGWWEVDPASGATTDVMDDGSGTEMTEYNVVMSNSVRRMICFGALGAEIAGQIMLISTMFATLSEMSLFRMVNRPGGAFGVRCFGA